MMATHKPGAGAKVLAYLASSRACMTLDEIEAELKLPRKRITAVICRLITSKYVVRQEKGCYQATAAGVKADAKGYTCGPQRPHTGTNKARANSYRQRLWTTMRLRRTVSTHDLVANARGPNATDAQAFSGARRYLAYLASAGIVVKLDHTAPASAPTSNGYALWRLRRDLGATAPVIRAEDGVVFNPNSRETIAIAGAST